MTDKPEQKCDDTRHMFKLEMHAKLGEGGSLYCWVCQCDGITKLSVRKKRNVSWTTKYSIGEEPNVREFRTLKAAHDALKETP